MTTTDSGLHFVQLNERVYKYIRQFTIKNSQDAFVELITNSIDAYNKAGKTSGRTVKIQYHSPNHIYVIDEALGLTSEEMSKYFLTVGEYTADAGSRGFFSRGAKDISAIGDITFTAIKDGKISQVYLNSDAYGEVMIADRDVTVNERVQFGLGGNGLNVRLDLLPSFLVPDPSAQAESLSRIGVLRDIMIDSNNVINYSHINETGEVLFTRRLEFSYPEGTKILDLTYNIPGYEQYQARFEIYTTTDPIPQPKKEDEMVFGFLIRDNTSVYEIGTIDDRFRWNPYMNRLYGFVTCNALHDMLLDYDANGPTVTNPTPIIDPSRITGTNKEHPFIVALLSIPKVRLDAILHELNTTISKSAISLEEIDQLLEELERYGLDVLDDEAISVRFVSKYDAELAKAIEDDRQKYVEKETSYFMTQDFKFGETNSDKYIKDQLVQMGAEPGAPFIAGEDGVPEPLLGGQDQPDLSGVEDPSDLLDLIEDDQKSKLANNPYIYKLGPDGSLVKLYIFQRGTFDQQVGPEDDYIDIKTKKFSIAFINDINLKARYNIQYADGVEIQLNLADPLVAKYMITDNVASGETQLSLQNVKSTQSLLFMQEIMIEVLSEIILENDIINKRLVLDSSDLNNAKKQSRWRNEIVRRIQDPMSRIFEKFITRQKDTKMATLTAIIDAIGDRVAGLIDLTVQGQDLYDLKDELNTNLSKLIE